MESSTIGQEIRKRRLDASIGLRTLSEACHWSASHLSRVECGHVQISPLETAKILQAIEDLKRNPQSYEPVKFRYYNGHGRCAPKPSQTVPAKTEPQSQPQHSQTIPAKSQHVHYCSCTNEQVRLLAQMLKVLDIPAGSIARRVGIALELLEAKLSEQMPVYEPEYNAVIKLLKQGRNAITGERQLSLF